MSYFSFCASHPTHEFMYTTHRSTGTWFTAIRPDPGAVTGTYTVPCPGVGHSFVVAGRDHEVYVVLQKYDLSTADERLAELPNLPNTPIAWRAWYGECANKAPCLHGCGSSVIYIPETTTVVTSGAASMEYLAKLTLMATRRMPYDMFDGFALTPCV
jgi:hypothetical protein